MACREFNLGKNPEKKRNLFSTLYNPVLPEARVFNESVFNVKKKEFGTEKVLKALNF